MTLFLYPRKVMVWLLLLCNTLLIFSTVAEARYSADKIDNYFAMIGLPVAFVLGWVVSIPVKVKVNE